MGTVPTFTLAQRIQRIKADINVALAGADAGIRRTVENALAKGLAGLTHDQQGTVLYLHRQATPGPDSEPETLERWLYLFNSPRKQPSRATGTIRITGTATTNVNAGTEFQLADGTVFTTDALVTITDFGGGNIYADAAVTASKSGIVGNADIGTTLTLVSPAAGVDSEATVQDDGSGAGLSGGFDLESRDEMWARLKVVVQNPPGAGNSGDYKRWALEVTGVTRAWVQQNPTGPGTVRVLFVMDAKANIIPTAGEVATVQAYIDARRPVAVVEFVAAAPTAKSLAFTIADVPVAARTDVETALKDLLIREAEPGTTLEHEQIIGAIAGVGAAKGFTLTLPAADVTHDTLEIPVFDTITWT